MKAASATGIEITSRTDGRPDSEAFQLVSSLLSPRRWEGAGFV